MNMIPEDALVTPAMQIFVNDLWVEAIRSEFNEWAVSVLESGWAKFGLAVLGFVVGFAVCRSVVGRMAKRSPFWRFALSVWFICCTFVGVTKVINILSKSGSDDGVTLMSAECGTTNGYSFVEVIATGGDPYPMWYREASSNDWTLATDDGWQAHLYDHSGAVHTREWRNPDTNATVTAHAMWYFGTTPPAVEIMAAGGVEVLSAAFTGHFVRFTWHIHADISLPEGSTVTLQNNFLDDSLPMWNDVPVDLTPDHATNVTTVTGFFLDRKTAWRFRLEVPR